jgi:hypothetical protein
LSSGNRSEQTLFPTIAVSGYQAQDRKRFKIISAPIGANVSFLSVGIRYNQTEKLDAASTKSRSRPETFYLGRLGTMEQDE